MVRDECADVKEVSGEARMAGRGESNSSRDWKVEKVGDPRGWRPGQRMKAVRSLSLHHDVRIAL